MESAEPAPLLDPLHVILEHLSGPDGNQKLYDTIARPLHLSCKQYQASARATLRQLNLWKYFTQIYGRRRASSMCGLEATIPTDLLLACPAVTSLTLAPQQLASLGEVLEEPAVKAMMAQLKHLTVFACPWRQSIGVQTEALGRLLWACRQLEEVDFSPLYDFQEPWLLLDPDSTSISSAVAPSLPLRSLKVANVPVQLVTQWVEQQEQQLCCSLRCLDVTYMTGVDPLDAAQLTGLVALEDLRLTGSHISGGAHLGILSGLTQLHLHVWGGDAAAAVEAALTLSNLRHLALGESVIELPEAMRALKQLTCLDISHSRVQQLPEDLGVWCPGLVRLEAACKPLAAVPASLGALTFLDLSGSSGEQLVLPTTLTSLRELQLARAEYEAITGMSGLIALERLNAYAYEHTTLGGSLAGLAPLTRLRHLTFHEAMFEDPGSFTAIGALQQLTYLRFSDPPHGHQPMVLGWEVLGACEPLLALKELDLSGCHQQFKLATLGSWLSRLTALVQLNLGRHAGITSDDLLYLPHQLLELNLSSCELQQMPLGLRQLSQLQKLDVSWNKELSKLPEWFIELRSLAWMKVIGTGLIEAGEPGTWILTQ
jgi:hypothetical protein